MIKKKLVVIILTFLLFISCKQKVEIIVYNETNLQRDNEIVELCLCKVGNAIKLKRGDKYILLDADNKQVPFQLLSDNHTLIFPASVKPNDSAKYTLLTGKQDSIIPKTYGRKVPERKDDFTWENDRIAFRMYGPALAKENPSNGVDVWLKRTENLIIDKFYKNDLAGIQSYHVDNGEGLDCYKVGHTLGAGGIAPYIDTTLFIGGNYNKCRVTESGPLRTEFQLVYDTINVGDTYTKGLLTTTIDAGSQFNKASILYLKEPAKLAQVASGIFLHDSVGVSKKDSKKGYIAYAEKAVSDAGIPSCKSYVGVIIPTPIDSIITKNKHLLAISKYRSEKPFVYYFGAGWSKWGFASEKDWFEHVEQTALKIKKPLRIEVRK